MYWYPNPQVIVLSSVPFEEGLGLWEQISHMITGLMEDSWGVSFVSFLKGHSKEMVSLNQKAS